MGAMPSFGWLLPVPLSVWTLQVQIVDVEVDMPSNRRSFASSAKLYPIRAWVE